MVQFIVYTHSMYVFSMHKGGIQQLWPYMQLYGGGLMCVRVLHALSLSQVAYIYIVLACLFSSSLLHCSAWYVNTDDQFLCCLFGPPGASLCQTL